MELSISVAADDRGFAKAMRRVLPEFDRLAENFEKLVLRSPIHDAILLGCTDSKPVGSITEVENSDGYFQVIVGCPKGVPDDVLRRAVFDAIERAVLACPFTIADKEMLHEFLLEWAKERRLRN